jgi:hypothetical protein
VRPRRDAALLTNGLHACAAGPAWQVQFQADARPSANALCAVNRDGQGGNVLRTREPLARYATMASPIGPLILAGSLGWPGHGPAGACQARGL